MKATIKINLAQQLFDLDSDAYEVLKQYLESLKQYFATTPGNSDEVMDDIEQRIAELLQGMLSERKQVIVQSDIEHIMSQMGTAEDFAREAEGEKDTKTESQDKRSSDENFSREHRRLFRDTENSILGGVASGLGAYFQVDPIWMRLAFVALFFLNLFGLVTYLVLWAIVPRARTTAERLQMQGRPVNVENIQQSVKEEFGKVRSNLNRFSRSDNFQSFRTGIAEIANKLGRGVLALMKGILILVGVAMVMAGIALLLSLLGGVWAGTYWFNGYLPHGALQQALEPLRNHTPWLGVVLLFVILLPLVAIISGLIRVLFNLRHGNRVLSALIWTLWSLALVFVLVTVLFGTNNLNLGQIYRDEHVLELKTGQTLYVNLNQKTFDYSNWKQYSVLGKNIVKSRYSETLLLEPEFLIRPSFDEAVHLEVEYRTLIPEESHPSGNPYEWSLQDTVLVLSNYWELQAEDTWRLPKVCVLLYLPEGQKVQLQPILQRIPVTTDPLLPASLASYGTPLQMQNGRLQGGSPIKPEQTSKK